MSRQHTSSAFRGSCPTTALVSEACAAGSEATDRWNGLTRDAHFVKGAGHEQVLEGGQEGDRFTDRVTRSLLERARGILRDGSDPEQAQAAAAQVRFPPSSSPTQ